MIIFFFWLTGTFLPSSEAALQGQITVKHSLVSQPGFLAVWGIETGMSTEIIRLHLKPLHRKLQVIVLYMYSDTFMLNLYVYLNTFVCQDVDGWTSDCIVRY